MMAGMKRFLRRTGYRFASGALRAGIFSLEVLSDLTPGVRMTGRRRLPQNMAGGILGAELATWAAISPSLLPRPWWVTAANVAIGQAAGHWAGATAAYVAKEFLRSIGKRPQDRLTYQYRHRIALGLAAVTAGMTALSVRNQRKQAQLVDKDNDRGPAQALAGTVVGTLGYGSLLLLGEAVQASVDQLSKGLRRWLPALVAWPLGAAGLAAVVFVLSNRVLFRTWIRNVTARAQELNRTVFPGSTMPWEPERSGSPWSYEPWTAVGLQGRSFLSSGPRADDIKAAMDCERAHEPIRIYAGLVPGRSIRNAARQVIAEMERTGAFWRNTIVIQMPAGSGWLNNWSTCSYEFLTRGNCATVTLQYDVLASVFSYVVDPDGPVRAAWELITAVKHRLEDLPEGDRPRLYFAGESLGAYAILDNYESVDDLLAACEGAVFSGPPRMSRFTSELQRDPGSLERVPVIDGGKHIRFAAATPHTRHDAFGHSYPQTWQRPRVLIAQHASDAIVWWDKALAFRRPGWIHEPQPDTAYADTFKEMFWAPFITFWQIGLDQVNSLNVPGGHGHNYFSEMFWYWDSVLGSQSRVALTPSRARRMEEFIRRDA